MRSHTLLLAVMLLVGVLGGCAFQDRGERQYELRGQILQIDKDLGTVTIRHGDIKGFMPAMTMPFKVKEKRLLNARAPGDLVNGTLVVTDTDAYLSSLDVTGHVDLAQADAESTRRASAGVSSTTLAPGALVPDVRLLDVNGRPWRLSSLRGDVVALTFIYTRCPLPDFCPRLDRQFAAAAARLRGDAGLAASVRLLSISFDPEYDTPAVLAAHARSVGADGTVWRFATADRRTLDAFMPQFGLQVVHEADNSITHNLRTAIVDRQGRLVNVYDGSDWTVDQLMADLAKAAGTR